MQPPARPDLPRTVLLVLIIGVLIVGSAWTLLPFLSALIWATTIVVPTWPLLQGLQRRTGGRRSVATAAMTLVVLAVFVVPFGLAVSVLLQTATEWAALVRAAAQDGLPAPPAWLASIPLVGVRLAARWAELYAGGPEAVADALRPFVRSTASWAMSISGGFTLVAVHFVLTVILVAILYSNGEAATRGLIMFGRRLGGARGERVVHLSAQALRGVALGVVITALVQSLIAGAGLWLAGIPRAGVLLAFIFVLCVAQLGPLPVLVPAIIWLFFTDNAGWGLVLTVVAIVVAVADNVLKPLLIRRGVDLPLLLIIPGVVGGLIGFGVVGLFIGPVLLAVTFTLLTAWVRDEPATVAPSAAIGDPPILRPPAALPKDVL